MLRWVPQEYRRVLDIPKPALSTELFVYLPLSYSREFVKLFELQFARFADRRLRKVGCVW
jgi:hypothetical protein